METLFCLTSIFSTLFLSNLQEYGKSLQKRGLEMNYKDEWRLLAISDNLDDVEHRPLTEEFLFYQAVATGDVEAVRKNCEQERFVSEDGVGTLSRNPITNLKYHFVITTAMITRMCGQNGMELEQAFRLSDFYIQKLDDLHTAQEVQNLHEEMVIDYTERMRREIQKDVISKHVSDCRLYLLPRERTHYG